MVFSGCVAMVFSGCVAMVCSGCVAIVLVDGSIYMYTVKYSSLSPPSLPSVYLSLQHYREGGGMGGTRDKLTYCFNWTCHLGLG